MEVLSEDDVVGEGFVGSSRPREIRGGCSCGLGQASGEDFGSDCVESIGGGTTTYHRLQDPKEAWDILEKLYEGKGWNWKFILLQELFQAKMREGSMDEYLRFVKEKLSELAAIGMKLDADIKLAIIVNGLSETYRYLVVNLEQQEMADFDELSARLLEEERKIHGLSL